ncbi:MAG: hypothetical protein E2O36_01965 [Proteobacteria bacterium]|nr:MAG: hypothetical protein E2O36_01965 [Pseudomonadota bacterium]
MNNDPYQSPGADVDSGGQGPENNIWWKIYFWLNIILMIMGFMAFPFIEGITLFDYLDIIVSLIAIVGLFGFAFYRPIGDVVFWRYFFYITLIESFAYVFVVPLIGYERFGQAPNFGAMFIFEVIYVWILCCALYFYAYKRSFIWAHDKETQ